MAQKNETRTRFLRNVAELVRSTNQERGEVEEFSFHWDIQEEVEKAKRL